MFYGLNLSNCVSSRILPMQLLKFLGDRESVHWEQMG